MYESDYATLQKNVAETYFTPDFIVHYPGTGEPWAEMVAGTTQAEMIYRDGSYAKYAVTAASIENVVEANVLVKWSDPWGDMAEAVPTTPAPRKLRFTGITPYNTICKYTGSAMTPLIEGTLPEGTTVTITGGEDGAGNCTKVGWHLVYITLSHPDYVTADATVYIRIVWPPAWETVVAEEESKPGYSDAFVSRDELDTQNNT